MCGWCCLWPGQHLFGLTLLYGGTEIRCCHSVFSDSSCVVEFLFKIISAPSNEIAAFSSPFPVFYINSGYGDEWLPLIISISICSLLHFFIHELLFSAWPVRELLVREKENWNIVIQGQ